MNKLRELIDFLASLRNQKTIRNSHLCIVSNNVEIEIEPNAIGRDPVTIRCKTEDAKKQVEGLLKDIKNA